MPLLDFFFWFEDNKFYIMLIMLKADYTLESLIQDYNRRKENIPDKMKTQLIS